MRFVWIALLVGVASVAGAQDDLLGHLAVETTITDWIVRIVPIVVTLAAALGAILPDKAKGIVGMVMRIINVLALNVLKAKNDPNEQ